MIKYLGLNGLSINEKFDFEDIFSFVKQLRQMVNFKKDYVTINGVIDSIKCWIQYYYLDSNEKIKYHDKLKIIISGLVKVFNMEWKDGYEHYDTNCLIFNFIS